MPIALATGAATVVQAITIALSQLLGGGPAGDYRHADPGAGEDHASARAHISTRPRPASCCRGS